MALILCTGSDPEALEKRRILFENEGHTVILATNERELQEACIRNKVDVAVFGPRYVSKDETACGRPCSQALSEQQNTRII
jgi:hypothetical protein